MSVRVVRVVVAAACLMWLAGCETASKLENPFRKLTDSSAPQASAASDGDTTGTIPATPRSPDSAPLTPELLGRDPNDNLNIGKNYFRQGSYGMAERHFRKAVEQHPRDAESWVGLAASYDRLRRFDLADRAYAQATRIVGPTPSIMNNQGFSYMLRGDYRRARAILLAARAKDPGNPYIQNNLQMLEESARKAKGIN